MPWTPSRFVNIENIYMGMNTVVHPWLEKVCRETMVSAENAAPRFGSAERHFLYHVSGRDGRYEGNIFCTGPRVEVSAWDLEFTVPVGGFQFGDIDPITGEAFPGGYNKRGSYVTLENKPETAGEDVLHRSRTWNKRSGETVKKQGFFDTAIRINFGTAAEMPSAVCHANLEMLAILLGKEIGLAIAQQVKREYTAAGYKVSISEPALVELG